VAAKATRSEAMSQPSITIAQADLARDDHGDAILQLLNSYSMDPMGDGKPLSEFARRELLPGLRQHPTTVVFLAWRDTTPTGLAVCFRGFSTFAARPLLNIHDFYVTPEGRGTGVGRRLLEAIEKGAREMGCCKLTLEVLENNQRAMAIYLTAGFKQLTYQPEAGGALFLAKPL
jgi:GNAT superfamily N-acetyltransferase